MIGVFHAGIRFVGELLEQLDSATLTHNQLLVIANRDYGMGWTSLDQVRRRTTWLRVAGFLELRFDANLVITDAGRQLLARLENYRPDGVTDAEEAVQPTVELAAAPAPIEALLDGLTPQALAARRRTWGYIPGVAPIADVFTDLTRAATPDISRQAWVDRCSSEYRAAESSAMSTLSAFRSAGLIE